jgi:hypothetical protein
VDFGELAHIIPAVPVGPRGTVEDDLSLRGRAHHDNLILLCPNCHKKIDKVPERFPATTLHDWKRQRAEEIRISVATPTFGTRTEARAHIAGQRRRLHQVRPRR